MFNRSKDLLSQPKDRKVASLLALASALSPIAGFHKFYLGQPLWGTVYLLLSWTPIPRIASGIEAIWYLFQDSDEFERRFRQALPSTTTLSSSPTPQVDPQKIGAIADAVRKLDQLREDGLISEYEFEQKRRQLLDRMV